MAVDSVVVLRIYLPFVYGTQIGNSVVEDPETSSERCGYAPPGPSELRPGFGAGSVVEGLHQLG